MHLQRPGAKEVEPTPRPPNRGQGDQIAIRPSADFLMPRLVGSKDDGLLHSPECSGSHGLVGDITSSFRKSYGMERMKAFRTQGLRTPCIFMDLESPCSERYLTPVSLFLAYIPWTV